VSDHTNLTTVLTLVVALAVMPAAGAVVGTAAPAGVTAHGSTVQQTDAVAEAGGQQAGATTSAVAACTFPFSATDATGTEVTVEQRPERVTTLAPSAAQTMWEIGGKSQVVGVSKYASYLDGAGERTNISTGGFGVSTEKIVGTQPDLVLAPNVVPNATVTKLRDSGLTVYKFEAAKSIADVREKTTLFGKLTGNCAGAAAANEWMMDNVDTAESATSDVDEPTVLYPLGGGYFAGSDTFVSNMISTAGGQNVLAEDISGFKTVSSEVVIQKNPDMIVFTGSSSYLAGQSPYKSLDAVKNDRTVTVNTDWMNQPAPRSVVFAVRNLTSGFHPDAAESAQFPTRAEARQTPTSTATATETATATATATKTATPKACEPSSDEPSLTQSRLYAPQKTLKSGEPGAIAGGFKVSGTANCAVVVSITMQVPSGMQIEGTSDVMSGGAGIVTAQFTVKPGNIRSIRANVFSQNTGERTVSADIQYWPVGHEDMAKQIDGITLSFDVQEPVTPGAGDSQNAGDSDGSETETTMPGFGAVVVVAALAVSGLLARRRN
jgi:iron complex transport system substrate-binding protein